MKKIALTLLVLVSIQSFGQKKKEAATEEVQNKKPWEVTEIYQDVPKVTPGENDMPPSDAIVLFDGTELTQWAKKEDKSLPADWKIENGEMVVAEGKGDITTKNAFGDMQLHIEWLCPKFTDRTGQNYANSGIFLMGLYELQVLNSYDNETYANGQAGSIYKQSIPLVNASKAPGTWQKYDIFFTAPRFSASGKVLLPAQVTVVHNGVLVQYNTVIEGPTAYIGKANYSAHAAKLPIVLQDHGNPVRFRNIWVREL